MPKKILLVILDGAADPDRSALAEANKPFLDNITEKGVAGLVENKIEQNPDSGNSHWVLFGYDVKDYPGRGIFDAYGIGIIPHPGYVYLRANFATVRELSHKTGMPGPIEKKTKHLLPSLFITDRRAGRDTTGFDDFAKKLTKINVDSVNFDFYHSVGHRAVLVLRESRGLSSAVTDSDPQVSNVEFEPVRPLNRSSEAVHTATALNKFTAEAYRILKDHPANKRRKVPANFVLLRGAAQLRKFKSFKEMHGLKAVVVGASPVVIGMAKALGMDTIIPKGATADTHTNLPNKAKAALRALRDHDMVILSILGTDVAAHDKNFELRREFVERIDREVFKWLVSRIDWSDTVIAVTSDHCTSMLTGRHVAGQFPFAIYTAGIKPNKVHKYDEESCKAPLGPVRNIEDFMEEVMQWT
jgi:2,3-bisphosphoglycerate-independent phosphoglycerate mutase